MTPALQKTTSRWIDRWTGGSGWESFKVNGQRDGLTLPGLRFDWWPPSVVTWEWGGGGVERWFLVLISVFTCGRTHLESVSGLVLLDPNIA